MAPLPTYRLKGPVPKEVEEALNDLPPLLVQLLYNRGITERKCAELFLNPNFDLHLHDPLLLTDMERAVTRIVSAIRHGEQIVIYTDYDCDGIPGGVVLHDFFEAVGYTHFRNYIPHRHHEGYGFNAESVDTFIEEQAKLIITVDCGIVDHEATKKAQDAGIDVIITDHHEPGETLPPAYAVINPKRDDAYPFKGLCGTGVAYKLVQVLLARGKKEQLFTLKDGWEKWWLDMVALATIADMAPLVDENRVLAQYGLQVLRKSRRPGIQQLLRKAGSDQRYLTEDDIGFTIGPRINAASRMDNPEDAFHMLRVKDEGEAGKYVLHLEKLNNERKGVVASMTKEAKKRLSGFDSVPRVIVLGNPEWRPSLVGLVANSLAEEYRRPAFVWGRDGKNVIKGSCRSDGTVSVVKLMQHVPHLFVEFGGHHASGGYSLKEDMIHTCLDALVGAHETLTEESIISKVFDIDATLLLSDITDTFVKMLRQLAPYGEANPKPLFKFENIAPVHVAVFGKTKNHTKLSFNTPGGMREAIAFFRTPDTFTTAPKAGSFLSLIAHIEESYFMGRLATRLRIIDIV